MDDRGEKERPGDTATEQLDELLEDPSRWPALDPDKLRHLLFYRCLAYGLDPAEAAVPSLIALHAAAVERLPAAVRRQVVLHLARACERVHREHAVREGAGCTNSLLPFLLHDPDPSVVSTAACEMTLLLPTGGADPLAGPRYIRSLADELADGDPKAGLLAGLLQLGDSRVAPLVERGWSGLDDDARQTLALLIQAFHGLQSLTAGFLMSWLEDEVRRPGAASFGVVAATLARAGRHAAEHGVTDLERAFPVVDAPEGAAPRVARRWTREEFASSMRARLMAVARAEKPPSLMPHVLNYWGFEEEAYHLSAAGAAAAAVASARGELGVCRPTRLELAPDWPEEPERETVVEWGSLDASGPTVATFRVTPADGASALVFTVYHPHATASHVMAVLPVTPGRAIVAACVAEVMRRNGDEGLWLLRALPDYVHLPSSSPLDAAASALAIAAAMMAVDGAPPLHGPAWHDWLAAASSAARVAALRREVPAAWERAQERAGRDQDGGAGLE